MDVFAPESKRILLVERDGGARASIAAILTRARYQVTHCRTGREALSELDRRHHDAVILELERGAGERASLLRRIRSRSPGTPALVLVGPSELHEAVHALRAGAEDYLVRPPDPFELRTRLGRILERHDLGSRIALLQNEVSRNDGLKHLVSDSTAMRSLLDRVIRVAPMRATVLILGESGVGKELVARAIHFNSPRRDSPFLALNCAAIPGNLIESDLFGHEKGAFTGAHARSRGKFEIAHRGTIFLDEIAETDPPIQAKLLRVLEGREFMRVGGDESIRVDVRLIAATNADLEELVSRGRFRRDLYYRLKVVTIRVPPLQERRQDIPKLVETFLDELSRSNAVPRKTVTPEVLSALETYHWPGNVRELKNVIESLLVSCPGDVVRLEDLPPSIVRERAGPSRPDLTPGMTLAEMEHELIRKTLEHTGGNRTHSAAMLGIGVRTLQRKIQLYGLDIAPRRRRPRQGAAGSGPPS